MREIHGHEINDCNEQIRITADERNIHNGNASHVYTVAWNDKDGTILPFQNGPIKEAGVNGITQEVLLAILIDRLECFQDSVYKCQENQLALIALRDARDHLLSRTRKRLARGVEGTHEL